MSHNTSLPPDRVSPFAVSVALSVGLVAVVTALACGTPPVDEDLCEGKTIPTFAEVTAFQNCITCHAAGVADRQFAPSNVNYDTLESARAQAKQGAARVVNTFAPMPPAGQPPLSQAEKDAFVLWANCGTPE